MAPRVTASTPVRRRRWPWLLVVLLVVVPTLEIAVIIAVGRVIGPWPTVLLLVLESMLGAWLVKREGARTWSALNAALSSGQMPSRQLADAALALVGGTLLLTPGFVTDVFGFFFILPFTRPLARVMLQAVVTRQLLGGVVPQPSPATAPTWARDDSVPRSGAATEVVEGEIIEGEIVD